MYLEVKSSVLPEHQVGVLRRLLVVVIILHVDESLVVTNQILEIAVFDCQTWNLLIIWVCLIKCIYIEES